ASPGMVLSSDTSGNTTWVAGLTNALSSGFMLVGNGSNVATAVQMSGDATISQSGALVISNNAITGAELASNAVATAKIADDNVTFAKIQNVNSGSMLGRSTAGAGDVEEISMGAGLSLANGTLSVSGSGFALNSTQILVGNGSNVAAAVSMSGDATLNNSGAITIVDNAMTTSKINALAVTNAKLATDAVTTVKIADDNVTFAKLQNISTSRILGRTTASSGDVEELSIGPGLTLSGGSLFSSGSGFALSSANILVGNASGVATSVAMSGDATISQSGALVISSNAITGAELATDSVTTPKVADDNITFAKLQNINTARMLGRTTAASGDVEEISMGAGLSLANGTLSASGSGFSLASANILVGDGSGVATAVTMSGDATLSQSGALVISSNAIAGAELANDSVTTAKVADDNITYAKIQNVTSNRIVGRSTAGSGDLEELMLGNGLTLSNGTLAVTSASGSSLAANNILIGNTSGVATAVATSGDATINNSGAVTVVSVGGSTAAAVNTATVAANSATSANTPLAIVKRDSTGGFSAGTVTSIATTIKDSGSRTATLAIAGTLVNTYALYLPTDLPAAGGMVLTGDTSGQLGWGAGLTNSLVQHKILVGNASNIASAVFMSGDATLADSGALTISTNAVTSSKIATDAVSTVK
ncbi:MAG: hypothetical protein AAB250_11290, partial [Bdellovibrionota bacterium]